jgi:hypothetical protein
MSGPGVRGFWLSASLAPGRASSAPARRRVSRVLFLGLAWWLATTSCSDSPVRPGPWQGPFAELQISASVAGTLVNTLVVTVSAADIEQDLIFNIQVVNGVASGTMTLPAGPARTVHVRAVNTSGVTTHEGSKQVDVAAGPNPVVTFTLLPLVGSQPIDVRIGNLTIKVTPGLGLITPGQAVVLSALVTDLNDVPVPDVDPANIRWASFDTRIATVNAQGTVTGERIGTVQIVASYGGAAGAARISVGPVGERILAAGDIAECTTNPTLPPSPPAQPQSSVIGTAAMLDTLQGLVLALGDNAYPKGRTRDYDQCYAPTWGRHKARTRPVPGNHEYESPTDTAYFKYFADVLAPFGATATDPTKGYYSFNVGSWHVIALSSEIDRTASSPQMAWLRNDLAATAAKCVIAYWHKPHFNSGSHHANDPSMRALWDTLYAKNADVILSAHEHLYERFGPQTPTAQPDPARGIRQFTVGTGGTSDLYDFAALLRPNSEFGLVGKFGVLEMVLGVDSYSWRFISSPDGVVRDVGVGTCH